MKARAIWIGIFFAIAVGTPLALTTEAAASPWAFVGPRYQAMGGAGVAVADDSLATYWNPASLGYARGTDVQLPVGVGASNEAGLLDALGDVLDLADDISTTLDTIEAGGSLTTTEAQNVLSLAGHGFLGLTQPGQSFQASFNLGLLGRHKQVGLSAVSLTTANVRPLADLNNLRLSSAAGGATARIEALVGSSGFTAPTDTALAAAIAGADANWNVQPGAESVTYAGQLVYLAEQAGLNTSDPAVRNMMITVATATASSDSSLDLAENTSGATVAGLSTEEFALSFGYALPTPFFKPLDKKIALGVNLKYMLGISYVETVRYNSSDDVDDVLKRLNDFDSTKTSHNFGLDLGLSAEPLKWVRLGLVARNVNSPNFDTVGGGSLELEPQVRGGIAVSPLEILTLAMDVDLTKNEAFDVPGFGSRLLSLGAELRLPIINLLELDLRGGAYKNLVEDMNTDWGLTGGLGLRVWEISLDLSGGASANTESFATSSGSEDLPSRLDFAASLKWEHRF